MTYSQMFHHHPLDAGPRLQTSNKVCRLGEYRSLYVPWIFSDLEGQMQQQKLEWCKKSWRVIPCFGEGIWKLAKDLGDGILLLASYIGCVKPLHCKRWKKRQQTSKVVIMLTRWRNSGIQIWPRVSSLPSCFELRYIHSCIPGLLPGDTCEIRCRFPDFLGDPVVAMCSTENTATWLQNSSAHGA